MVIPANRHIDNLDLSQLKAPLLNDYYGSAIQREDVAKIANEIMRRHLAKLPSETGNLKSTARVATRRSAGYRDGRWEAEYSVGGPRADYIVPLEDEHHYLDQVLREMGFRTGDIVNGPTGRIPASEKSPAPVVVAHAEREADVHSGEQVQRVERPSFRAVVSGKTYNEALSRDVSGFADEHGIPDPASRRQGKGYRYTYGELSDDQARNLLRRLEHGSDTTGFDDSDAIAAAKAVKRDYDRIRTEFDISRPDAPYVTFRHEVQQRMREQRGDQ